LAGIFPFEFFFISRQAASQVSPHLQNLLNDDLSRYDFLDDELFLRDCDFVLCASGASLVPTNFSPSRCLWTICRIP
jgi:hypothetical protein